MVPGDSRLQVSVSISCRQCACNQVWLYLSPERLRKRCRDTIPKLLERLGAKVTNCFLLQHTADCGTSLLLFASSSFSGDQAGFKGCFNTNFLCHDDSKTLCGIIKGPCYYVQATASVRCCLCLRMNCRLSQRLASRWGVERRMSRVVLQSDCTRLLGELAISLIQQMHLTNCPSMSDLKGPF